MSIQLVLASKEITPVVAAPPPTTSGLTVAAFLGWSLLAFLAAKLLGAFRRRSIEGPPRLAADESVWPLLFAFFAGGYAAILLTNILIRFLPEGFRTNSTLQGALSESLAVIAILGLMRVIRPRAIELLGLQPIQIPRGIALGAVTLFVVFPVVMIIGVITVFVFNATGRPVPTQEVLQALGESKSGPIFIISIAFAVVGAPIAEELAFRGVVQTVLSRAMNWCFDPASAASASARSRWSAVVITAALFAAAHNELAIFPALFFLALGLGYLYERTGNLWATIAMHSLFNTIEIVFYLSTKSG